MPPRPLVAIAVKRGGCVLAGLMEKLLEGIECRACPAASDGLRFACGSAVAGRVLRSFSRGDSVECWVKVSGVPRLVAKLVDAVAGSEGFKAQAMVRTRYGALVRLTSRRHYSCSSCFSLNPPPGVLPKMTIVVPGGRVEIFFAFDQKGLQEAKRMGYELVRVEELEFSDYVLTPFQEYVLYRAYEEGRYEYPRRVRLSKLAQELNVSTPTLAEVLRRAEAKIVDAFMSHYMPHYYVMRVLHKGYSECQLLAEVRRKRGDSEGARERRELGEDAAVPPP